jgi:hypothetical protein
MRNLVSVLVCAVVLYAVDAAWFGGQYFTAFTRMLSDVSHHFLR